MSFSFSSLIRLLVLMAVGSTMLAVGLSRLDPPRPGMRVRRMVRHSNINEYFLDVTDRTPRWLDTETGQMASYPLEDSDVLEAASCSPWVDEKNQYQAVGRWTTRVKDGPMSMSKDFGLARYAFPSGVMLDHVSTEIVPVGPPCWYPGIRARILFAAGDGMLYHFAFEPEPWLKGADPEAKGDLKPKPLIWRCPKPGNGDIYISDAAWPDDSRLGGRLVVALREQQVLPNGRRVFTRTRLWWVKLNVGGTEIVEVGRLLISDGEGADFDHDQRAPTVGSLADGTLTVAYLRQRIGETGWEVRIAPIEFEEDHQDPRAFEARSLLLCPRGQPAPPTFSSDGRWLNVITGLENSENRVARLSLDRLFTSSN
jgi:hypothetical protein